MSQNYFSCVNFVDPKQIKWCPSNWLRDLLDSTIYNGILFQKYSNRHTHSILLVCEYALTLQVDILDYPLQTFPWPTSQRL